VPSAQNRQPLTLPSPIVEEGTSDSCFFGVNHEVRDHVIAARDRCDYTIDRVRAVSTNRHKYPMT
jgi:hypothetical protein